MKLFLISTFIVFNAIATCPATLEITLFSKPFVEIESVKGYSEVLDEVDYLKFDLVEDIAKYKIEISAGAMNEHIQNRLNGDYTTRPLLISDIMIKDTNSNVIFRDIKRKRVKDNKVSAENIMKYVKKHIRKKLPFCTKN